MNLSELFIRKPIMTTLVTIVVLAFGISSYDKLPISDLPVVDYPVIMVSVGYPGASPATMASAVATPLENECMQIPGLTTIISDNREGSSSLTLTFELSRNVDLAAMDVQSAITRAMANLPQDLPSQPIYSKVNPSDTPILYLAVTSDTLRPRDLYEYGNRMIGRHLSMIEGVSRVDVWGAKAAVRVQVDPDKLAAFELGLNDVVNTVNSGTVTIPAGSLNGASKTFAIEPQGQLLKARDYEQLAITYRNGAPIRLADVALCLDSTENDVINALSGHAGKVPLSQATVVAVSRQGGANTVAVANKVKKTLDSLKSELPAMVHMDVLYDKSISIIDSVNDVKFTIVLALVLVVAVIFLFLGRMTETIIPAVALPLSLVATFIVMQALDFTLDNLSLMALTLSVGFVVDDAIVVLENTVRRLEHGERPIEAAIHSAQEIAGTVVSMTLSLVTVFVPLLFMGGVVGRNFKEFAATVVIAIVCSGIISLTLSPMMCSRMLTVQVRGGKRPLQELCDQFMNMLIHHYGRMLEWVLHRRWVSLVLWVLCIAGTGWLFTLVPKTFMPEGDSGAIQGALIMSQGTSTEQIQAYQQKVNAVLQDDARVDKILTITGTSSGADQSSGMTVITLKPHGQRPAMPQMVHELRAKLSRIPDGMTFLKAIPALSLSAGGESTAQGDQYSFSLTGAERDKVYEAAIALAARMAAMPQYFVDIQNSVKLDMPQLNVEIRRDRASALGLTASDIESAISHAFAGGRTTTYKTDVDQYNVIVELDKRVQRLPQNLERIFLRASTGKLVPLSAVATWTPVLGPQSVPHASQMNSATVSFNLKSGVPLGQATTVLNDLARRVMPNGVNGELQGQAQEFEDAVASLGILVVVSIFLMYVILGILYESYIHPFTVLTTLPVAAFGGLLTLWLFHSELSIYAYVGLFMLFGIVAKNGIMMVDFAHANRVEKQMGGFAAILDACRVRFRPILMTGVAAIMGALPIAIGIGADGSSRRPLGLIVAGGLIFAQVVTLFVTPGIFLIMQSLADWIQRKRTTAEPAATASPAAG